MAVSPFLPLQNTPHSPSQKEPGTQRDRESAWLKGISQRTGRCFMSLHTLYPNFEIIPLQACDCSAIRRASRSAESSRGSTDPGSRLWVFLKKVWCWSCFFWSCKLGHFHQLHYKSVYLLNSVKRWLPTSYQVITAEICSSVGELPVCQRLFSLTSSFKRHHTAVCCSLLFTLRLCS